MWFLLFLAIVALILIVVGFLIVSSQEIPSCKKCLHFDKDCGKSFHCEHYRKKD